ncbi:MAG: bifunctional phosphoglucose/phosphomannose isomerase [bacterium]
MILNNFEQIKKLDCSNMYELIANFSDQFEDAIKITEKVKVEKDNSIKNIIVAGMGGSAIGGDLLKTYLSNEIKIPIMVIRNYSLPEFVDKDTLVIACSYSGNTEETLSCYKEAHRKKAKIVVITSGGKLEKLALKNKNILVNIPKGMSPRAALGYLFLPQLIVLQKMGLIKNKQMQIKECLSCFKKLFEQYAIDNPLESNLAKQMALKFHKKLVLVYGGVQKMEPIVMRWKAQFNENSKMCAFFNVFPELNHNEIVGWETPASWLKDVIVIYLKDIQDHSRIKLRMDITEKAIKNKIKEVVEIKFAGKNVLTRLFSFIYLGDFISFYLAILNNQDPTTIEPINYLKNELAKIK